MKYILIILMLLLVNISALADETSGAVNVLNHDCSRVNKYLNYDNLDSKLDLMNKEAEEGLNLTNEFKVGPSSKIEEFYYSRETNKGRRYLNTFQSEQGILYGLHENGNMALNGKLHNKVYDENGLMLSTASLMYSKYKNKFDTAKDYIYFDSIDDKNAFLIFMHTVYGLKQSDWYDVNWVGNKIGVRKSDVINVINHSEEDDILFNNEVDRLYNIVNGYIPNIIMDHSLYAAIGYALNNEYTWTESYLEKSMNKVIADKKGVCYHFAKLAAAILDKYDYNYTYEFGELDGENHVWLIVENKINPGYTRFDPTVQGYFTAYGFLESYKIRGLTND